MCSEWLLSCAFRIYGASRFCEMIDLIAVQNSFNEFYQVVLMSPPVSNAVYMRNVNVFMERSSVNSAFLFELSSQYRDRFFMRESYQ